MKKKPKKLTAKATKALAEKKWKHVRLAGLEAEKLLKKCPDSFIMEGWEKLLFEQQNRLHLANGMGEMMTKILGKKAAEVASDSGAEQKFFLCLVARQVYHLHLARRLHD